MMRPSFTLVLVLALSLAISSEGIRLNRKVKRMASVSLDQEPDPQGPSVVQEENYSGDYNEQDIDDSALPDEKVEDDEEKVDDEEHDAPSLMQEEVGFTSGASLGQSDPPNPRSFRFHGVTGKYASCINGLWKATTSSRLLYKKADNPKAQFKWFPYRPGVADSERWRLNITGGPGACGRSLGKKSSMVILRSRIATANKYIKQMPYSEVQVKNDAGKFLPQRRLWFDHSLAIVACKYYSNLQAMDITKNDCAVSHLKPKFNYSWPGTWLSTAHVSNGREFAQFQNDHRLADRACNKARGMVVRYLPTKINGKRVLVDMGKGRWKVDKSNLRTNKTFLSYRTRWIVDGKVVYKPSGPYPGPKWGTIVRNKWRASDVVKVAAYDKSKTCKAFLVNADSTMMMGD